MNMAKVLFTFTAFILMYTGLISCSQPTQKSQPQTDSLQNAPLVPPDNTRYTPNDPNRKQIYLKVVLQNFSDSELLNSVYKSLLATSKNHNYEMSANSPTDPASLTINIWSELPGPISLIQTLQNALKEYSLRFEHQDDALLIISPK